MCPTKKKKKQSPNGCICRGGHTHQFYQSTNLLNPLNQEPTHPTTTSIRKIYSSVREGTYKSWPASPMHLLKSGIIDCKIWTRSCRVFPSHCIYSQTLICRFPRVWSPAKAAEDELAFPVYFSLFMLAVRVSSAWPVNKSLNLTTDVQKPQFLTSQEQPWANFHLCLPAASCSLLLSPRAALLVRYHNQALPGGSMTAASRLRI